MVDAETVVACRRRAPLFAHWADWTDEARMLDMTKMALRHSSRRIAKAGLRLLGYAVRLSILERAAAHFACTAAVARAFRWWIVEINRGARQRMARAHWAGRLAAVVLSEWRRAARRIIHQRVAMAGLERCRRGARSLRGITAWARYSAAARVNAEHTHLARRAHACSIFLKWRHVTSRSMWEGTRAESFARANALRLGLRVFLQTVRGKTRRTAAAASMAQRLYVLRLTRTMHLLRTHATSHMTAQRRLVLAISHRRWRLLTQCYDGLIVLLHERRRHAAAAESALSRHRSRIRSSVLEALRVYCAGRRAAHVAAGSMCANAQRRISARAIESWGDWCARRRETASLDDVSWVAKHERSERDMRTALRQLQRKALQARNLAAALASLSPARMERGWHGFCAHVQECQRLRSALARWNSQARIFAVANRAAGVSFARDAARRWQHWRAWAARYRGHSLRVQYLVAKRWARGARGALYVLSAEVQAAARAQAEILRARANQLALEQHRRRVRRRTARLVFNAWTGYTSRNAAIRWSAICHLRKRTLRTWATVVVAGRRLDHLEMLLRTRAAASFRLAILRAWRRATVRAARVRAMARRALQRLGACVLQAWHATAAAEAMEYRERDMHATAYHMQRLAGVTFFHWRALAWSTRGVAALSNAGSVSSSRASSVSNDEAPAGPPESRFRIRGSNLRPHSSSGLSRATVAASQRRHLSQLRALGPLRPGSSTVTAVRLFADITPHGGASPSGTDVALTLASHMLPKMDTESVLRQPNVPSEPSSASLELPMDERLESPMAMTAPRCAPGSPPTAATIATSVTAVASLAADFHDFERAMEASRGFRRAG